MEIRPHLSFLPPVSESTIDPLHGRVATLICPTLAAQYGKFRTKFEKLEEQFAKDISLSDSVEGLTPERILVIEIAGSISNFAKTLQKLPGFHNLQHFLTDDYIETDTVYRDDKGKKKPVKREIYLSMSNHDGLKRLFSKWKSIAEQNKAEHGFTALRDALCQLQNIRFWSTEDRLKNTGLLEDWQDRRSYLRETGENASIPFEIELWYYSSAGKRAQTEKSIKKLIAESGGSISGRFAHEGIAYHGLRGELPISQVESVLKKGADCLRLMRCDEIMYFRPLGQCGFKITDEEPETPHEQLLRPSASPDSDSPPIAALLDGLPLENHAHIKGRIIIDDPDGFSELYQKAEEQSHGTAMASLIIHGDQNSPHDEIQTPLYVRPILAPGRLGRADVRLECIPDKVLPIDLIHRTVKRMFDGDGNEPPTAPNVQVINLSVGDPNQLFDRNISPWARMIDWLSHRYNVLFIISAGNHCEDIELEITNKEFSSLSAHEIENAVLTAVQRDRWKRRIMSPGESVNAVTVKAAHHDLADDVDIPGSAINPFQTADQFSPINPISLGKNNAIKPEIMMSGGRASYRNLTYIDSQPTVLRVISCPKRFAPGHRVATPGNSPGAINSVGYSFGTSNAAALTTRRTIFLHETIQSMRELNVSDSLNHARESLVLKALILHGAELPTAAKNKLHETILSSVDTARKKEENHHFFGYGLVNEERIHGCAPNQATLLHTGKIRLDSSHTYEFPLPSCLAASSEPRSMIITLAWFSPINPMHNEYCEAQLWVSDPKSTSPLQFTEGDYYHHHQKKGSAFHNVIRGDRSSDYFGSDHIKMKVNCKARAGAKNKVIPYALAVTLITENKTLPIYDQVKAMLEQKAVQRTTAKVDG